MKKSLIKLILIILLLSFAFVFVKDYIKTKNNNQIKIAFLGESLTFLGCYEETGYVKLTIKELENRGKKVELIPVGLCGARSFDILNIIDNDVISKKPDLLIMMIGINDALAEPDKIQNFKNNIKQIIKKLKENKINTIILNITVTEKDAFYANDAINQHNKVISDITKQEKIKTIDINSVMKKQIKKSGKNTMEEYFMTEDGIHLSNLGNKILADTLVKNIRF